MLTLYFSPGTSSFATHIALHEIGAPFEAKPVLLSKKEQQQPAYLAINPEGKVPALAVDGRLLTEVAATLYYLARRHPEAGLFPAGDIEAEAQVISWMSFAASALHPARLLEPPAAQAVWGHAERRLGDKDWAIGPYSIADIHVFRLFWRFNEALGLDKGKFPRLHAHCERMLARPAVIKTMAAEKAIG
ncbi:MAG: glutathione S-transferase family protein [Hyphomicrobiaceae bacterium]